MIDQSPDDLFQTQTTLRRLLDEAGLAPRKRFGQHFLIDRNLMQKLIDAADLHSDDTVLEIGPGTGSLTCLLAHRVAAVVASEIDPRIAEILLRQTAGFPNVRVIVGDALKHKAEIAPELAATLQYLAAHAPAGLKLVANLPYDAATPILMDLLLSDIPFSQFCFTVQAEVADRLLAQPGTAAYGPISILTQALTTPHRIAKVPPQAFWPRPKVHSAMIRLTPLPRAQCGLEHPGPFSQFVRTFFLHRRKTMGHNAAEMPAADRILLGLQRLGLPPAVRPEDLTVPQWIELWNAAR